MAVLDDVCATMHGQSEGADSKFVQVRPNRALRLSRPSWDGQPACVVAHSPLRWFTEIGSVDRQPPALYADEQRVHDQALCGLGACVCHVDADRVWDADPDACACVRAGVGWGIRSRTTLTAFARPTATRCTRISSCSCRARAGVCVCVCPASASAGAAHTVRWLTTVCARAHTLAPLLVCSDFIRNLFPEDTTVDERKRPTTASFKIRVRVTLRRDARRLAAVAHAGGKTH